MKKQTVSLLCTATLAACFVAFAGCANGHGLEFAYTDTSSAVISGTNCKEEELAVPGEYEGKPVLGVAEYAFVRNASLKSVTLPEGVTYLGAGAFYSCYELSAVNLPSTLTEIGCIAFRYCEKLNKINYNGTKAQWYALDKAYLWDDHTGSYTIRCTDGELTKAQNGNDLGTAGLSYDVNPLKTSCILITGLDAASSDVVVPEKYYHYTVEEIWGLAFSGASITSVRLPEGLRQIGGGAFSDCASLTTVYLPSTLNYLGEESFKDCTALTDIHFAGTRADWDNLVKGTAWDDGAGTYAVHCSDDNV